MKDGYITGTDDIAIDFYSDIVNRFDQYSNAMPTEFSVIVTGEEGADYLYFITFKDEKKAQKFFDEYIDDAEVELLEKKGVEYASNYNEFEDHTNTYSAYHKDNKVMVIICLPQSDYEEEFIEDICEILELPSPLED